jgi:hypothetical protein
LAAAANIKEVCNTSTVVKYTAKDKTEYDFHCIKGAKHLIASATATLAAAYLM